MKLLVGTSKALIMIDDSGVHEIDRYGGQFYGVTWDDKQIIVSCKGSKAHGTFLRYYDHSFNKIKDFKSNTINDVHQIAMDKKNGLWVTSTGRNSLVLVNGKECKEIKIGRRRRDINHINSVWVDGDSLWLCFHNKWKSPHNYESEFRKYPATKDINVARPLKEIKVGRGCHNVYEKDGYLFLCSSNQYSFMKYDLETSEIVNTLNTTKLNIFGKTYWHCRGLAYDGKYFYVGLSLHARREIRHDVEIGGIMVVDENLKLVSLISLEKIGQVNEIRCLDKPDFAHNGRKYENMA